MASKLGDHSLYVTPHSGKWGVLWLPGPPGSPPLRTTRVSRYQKGKEIWILQKQETVSGSGVSWVVCKSAPCCIQITTPVPHHSVFYRPDALPATQPTVSKHWRQFYLVVLSNTHTHTHTHFSGTTRVVQYQKGKTNLDITEARHSEWQWHQLGHMQVCTLLQTDNHARQHLTTQFFYRLDALPATQPTASKHWRPDCFYLTCN